MKTNELRIGNWVNNMGVMTKFEEGDWDCIINKLYSQTPMDRYEPIPLTEEWLLKFGFTFYRENMYDIKDFTFLLDRFTLWDYTGEERYLIACSVNHVHQLQNLYFALTGEELEIK